MNDDYLWTGRGTPSDDLAAIERELGGLAWQPRALEFDTPDALPPPVALLPTRTRTRRRWSPSFGAGLLVAAAVLLLAFWLRPSPIPRTTPAPVNPTAPPRSPDLKDPFANSGAGNPGGFTTPITDPKPSTKVVSPDLKDPFAGSKPGPKRRVSPDLKDPFADSPPAARGDSQLVDPFAGSPKPKHVSPDLSDPFGPPPKSQPSPAPSQPKSGKQQVSPDLKDPFAHD